MALWSFTEVSEKLNCSPQNIFAKKAKLKSMGFVEIGNDGKEKINDSGYNYLLEQRKRTLEKKSNNLNNDLLNNQQNISNSNDFQIQQQNDYIVEFLKNEVEELKTRVAEEQEQKKYWQNLYIQQNEDFKKLAFPPMLDTQEGNQITEERTKRGFFSRFFGQ